jgi:hypothetical protein
MRKTRLLAFILMMATSANAAPLDSLTNDQKAALSQLFGGYSESFLCNKQVDFDVAAAFLKSKLATDTLSLAQAAHFAHFAVGAHIIDVAQLQKQQLGPKDKEAAQKAIKEHCMKVEHAFGPKGEIIPGLLK